MVQHKQTRELYALKYINKAKCVKMKAVANIVQERRLLEEVRRTPRRPRYLILARSTIPLSSTSDMRSRTTTTASLSSISCSAVTCAVRPLPFSLRLPHPPTVHLDRLGALPEDTVRFYIAQLTSALAFLHENHIMHRFVPPFLLLRLLDVPLEISSPTTSSSTSVATPTSQTSTSPSTIPTVACSPASQEAWPTWRPRFSHAAATPTRSTGGPSAYAHTSSSLAVAHLEAKRTAISPTPYQRTASDSPKMPTNGAVEQACTSSRA
jgi:hypothetical protein